jgi:cytochrome c-type biogenesis protein CcmH/NrfG
MGVGCAGLVLHKHRDFRRALADLRRVVAGTTPSSASTESTSDEPAAPENLKVVWNFVGLCEANLGHVAEALQAYDQALKIDPMFKEARLNKVGAGVR